MRLSLVVFGLALAASPVLAVAGQPHATDEQRRLATTAYVDCLSQAAVQLDDGKSDAASVGVAIAPQCHGELSAMADTFAQGYDRRVHDLSYQRFLNEQLGTATAVVLKVRRDRSAEGH